MPVSTLVGGRERGEVQMDGALKAYLLVVVVVLLLVAVVRFRMYSLQKQGKGDGASGRVRAEGAALRDVVADDDATARSLQAPQGRRGMAAPARGKESDFGFSLDE